MKVVNLGAMNLNRNINSDAVTALDAIEAFLAVLGPHYDIEVFLLRINKIATSPRFVRSMTR